MVPNFQISRILGSKSPKFEISRNLEWTTWTSIGQLSELLDNIGQLFEIIGQLVQLLDNLGELPDCWTTRPIIGQLGRVLDNFPNYWTTLDNFPSSSTNQELRISGIFGMLESRLPDFGSSGMLEFWSIQDSRSSESGVSRISGSSIPEIRNYRSGETRIPYFGILECEILESRFPRC